MRHHKASEKVSVRALNFVDGRTNESRCSEVVECSFVYFLHEFKYPSSDKHVNKLTFVLKFVCPLLKCPLDRKTVSDTNVSFRDGFPINTNLPNICECLFVYLYVCICTMGASTAGGIPAKLGGDPP